MWRRPINRFLVDHLVRYCQWRSCREVLASHFTISLTYLYPGDVKKSRRPLHFDVCFRMCLWKMCCCLRKPYNAARGVILITRGNSISLSEEVCPREKQPSMPITIAIIRVLTLLINKSECICEGQSWWDHTTKNLCRKFSIAPRHNLVISINAVICHTAFNIHICVTKCQQSTLRIL